MNKKNTKEQKRTLLELFSSFQGNCTMHGIGHFATSQHCVRGYVLFLFLFKRKFCITENTTYCFYFCLLPKSIIHLYNNVYKQSRVIIPFFCETYFTYVVNLGEISIKMNKISLSAVNQGPPQIWKMFSIQAKTFIFLKDITLQHVFDLKIGDKNFNWGKM